MYMSVYIYRYFDLDSQSDDSSGSAIERLISPAEVFERGGLPRAAMINNQPGMLYAICSCVFMTVGTLAEPMRTCFC